MTGLNDLNLTENHTYADYLKWTFEERVELIKGKIFKIGPTPNRIHQHILGAILSIIHNQIKGQKIKVYNAPFDVRLPIKSNKDEDIFTVVQPDICVICDPSKLDEAGCIGAPDIIIEVLSNGNNQKELQNKYEVYEESGVKEYWIVSPYGETFFIYTLINGKYTPSRFFTRGDTITTPILPGFILELDDVFEEED